MVVVSRVSWHVLRALMTEIRSEIDRVYWNVHQSYWRNYECGCPVVELDIPGLRWRQPVPCDDADCSGEFAFDGVVISWSKGFERSMFHSSSDITPAQWVEWFNRVMAACERYEAKSPFNRGRTRR